MAPAPRAAIQSRDPARRLANQKIQFDRKSCQFLLEHLKDHTSSRCEEFIIAYR